MSRYAGEYSHVKVVLSDVLDLLAEQRDLIGSTVLRSSSDATAGELQNLIGQCKGYELAISRLELHFGAEKVNPDFIDRRY